MIDICRCTETSADAITIREKGYEFEGEQRRLLRRFVGVGGREKRDVVTIL